MKDDMNNQQTEALLAVRRCAETIKPRGSDEFVDGVSVAVRMLITHIDWLLEQVQAGHQIPFQVQHSAEWPFEARVVPAPQQIDDWKMVPVKPTSAMSDAGGSAVRVCYGKQYHDRRSGEMMCDYVYRKMLEAAPQQPALEPLQDDEILMMTEPLRPDFKDEGVVLDIARAIERAHGIKDRP